MWSVWCNAQALSHESIHWRDGWGEREMMVNASTARHASKAIFLAETIKLIQYCLSFHHCSLLLVLLPCLCYKMVYTHDTLIASKRPPPSREELSLFGFQKMLSTVALLVLVVSVSPRTRRRLRRLSPSSVSVLLLHYFAALRRATRALFLHS